MSLLYVQRIEKDDNKNKTYVLTAYVIERTR